MGSNSSASRGSRETPLNKAVNVGAALLDTSPCMSVSNWHERQVRPRRCLGASQRAEQRARRRWEPTRPPRHAGHDPRRGAGPDGATGIRCGALCWPTLAAGDKTCCMTNAELCWRHYITDVEIRCNGVHAANALSSAPWQVAGFINFVKQENMFYPACTLQRNGRTCNKKAMEQAPGSWCGHSPRVWSLSDQVTLLNLSDLIAMTADSTPCT